MKYTSRRVTLTFICKSFLRRRPLYSFIGFCIVYNVYFLGTTNDAAFRWPKDWTETTKRSTGTGGSLGDMSFPRNETSLVPSEIVGTSTPQRTTKPPLPLLDNIPINPPILDLDLWNKILESKEDTLPLLSDLIQKQIRDVQLNCTGVTLKCGHFIKDGGFGSQVHHRVACLMLSYVMRVPLIHDEIEGWLYPQKWSDLFVPLGSNCSEGPLTFTWTWDLPNLCNKTFMGIHTFLNNFKGLMQCLDVVLDSWPLTYGIPVTQPLADFINKNVEHPFPWLVGQFMKYSLKLKPQIERYIKRDMAAIKFQRPIIGLHVRRTDKLEEIPTSHHEIQEYMTWAEEDYTKLLNLSTLSEPFQLKPTVFIASDDAATVILQAQKIYTNWTVLGFPSQPTLKDALSRKESFYDIVRDIFILSECDYVVCGFASNVCTLVLEMLSFKHRDGYSLVKSMDINYRYSIHWKEIWDLKVVGIRPNDMQFLKRKSRTAWE